MRRAAILIMGLSLAGLAPLTGQNPLRRFDEAFESRYSRSAPVLAYTLRVDSADLSGFSVEIRIRNAPDTFDLAMAAHPEYDDRYWRFVEGLTAIGPSAAVVTRVDSALWRVVAPGGECVVRYRIRLPPSPNPRAAWRPFLTATGGLVGGPHGLMYLPGATLAPAHLTLDLPPGWSAATGLEPTADPKTFYAPSAFVLLDAPILVGRWHDWTFRLDGVPHRVAYWALPQAISFDSLALIDGFRRIAGEAIRLFGRAPYRDYTVELQDGSFGALEHLNSVTLGVDSARLSRGLEDVEAELAHEYLHTWNLMRIRPSEYGDVRYRSPPRSRGLWWSEGITMYYADLLERRAGLPTSDSTRSAHLEGLIARYLAHPGNARFSPESVSVVAYGASPGALGDYDASVHLQGELIGVLLDLLIRDATDGRRSLDDVMRSLLERFSGERGFTTADLERTVHDTCGCPVHGFFDRYVRTAHLLDFDRYLRLAGFRLQVAWEPATDDSGHTLPDLRVTAWDREGDPGVHLYLYDAGGIWSRAGLHTSDRIVSVNDAPIARAAEFRELRTRLSLGDTVTVEVSRASGPAGVRVVVTGYDRPVVRLVSLPEVSARQRRIGSAWVAGDP
jgi:predicted metalloprotease with PDZ domain